MQLVTLGSNFGQFWSKYVINVQSGKSGESMLAALVMANQCEVYSAAK